MENAVKALLIVAGVLIGLMILSLGISLYTSLSQYVESAQIKMEEREIQEFNVQFLKYINCSSTSTDTDFTLTIQDIVTAANNAYENNQNYESNYYVQVNLNGVSIERDINSKSAEILSNNLGKEYKCSYDDVKINTMTERVYQLNFYEK